MLLGDDAQTAVEYVLAAVEYDNLREATAETAELLLAVHATGLCGWLPVLGTYRRLRAVLESGE